MNALAHILAAWVRRVGSTRDGVRLAFYDSVEWWVRRRYGNLEHTDAIASPVELNHPCWIHLREGRWVVATDLHHIWYPPARGSLLSRFAGFVDQPASDHVWVCRDCHDAVTRLARTLRCPDPHAEATRVYRIAA